MINTPYVLDFSLKTILGIVVFHLIFKITQGRSLLGYTTMPKRLFFPIGLLGIIVGGYSGLFQQGLLFLGANQSILYAFSSGSIRFSFITIVFLAASSCFWSLSAIGLTRWFFSTKLYLKSFLIFLSIQIATLFFFPSILDKMGAVFEHVIPAVIFFFFLFFVPAIGGMLLATTIARYWVKK